MVSQMNKSNEELNQKFHEATAKIQNLNDNANETVCSLNLSIETESENLIRNIKTYLNSREIRTAIRQWSINMDDSTNTQLSQSRRSAIIKSDQSSGPNIYESLALRKLVDQIDFWIKANKYDERMISTLENKINSKFEVLKGEMADINNEMTDGNSLSSYSSGSTLPEDDIVEVLTSVKKARRKKLKSKIEDIAQGTPESRVILMPKVLIARAILSTMNLGRSGRRISAYTSDPKEFVKDKAVIIVDVLLKDEKLLQKLCARYTETLHDYVENIKQSIPKFVAVNQKLMEEITLSRQMTCENKDALTETIKKLDSVRELTRGYECLYVRDFRKESLKLPETDTLDKLSKSSRQNLAKSLSNPSTSHSVNCTSFCGQLGTVILPDIERPTSIMSRTSNFNLDEETVFKENARLRSLSDINIAPFLGTVRRDRKAVYIFAGNLRPIHRYLAQPHLPDIKGLTINIINGLVSGLAVLHKINLVHMELTPQSIMIDADDEEVKLFGGCLPQKIPSLQNNDSEKVGFLQFLSPDVLRGNQYSKADDIYSLALVVWNLIFKNCPFQDQNALTRASFIEQLNPEKMLTIQDSWPAQLQEFFRRCLFSKASDRFTIDQVAETLSQFELKDVICEVSTVQRRQVYNRLSRSKPRSSHNSNFEYEQS
ncbi:hypothetical protein LOTGIDRAFT_231964 [Lottia gigantea]|uniref:Protein kinase domain-containing protein n=1 Tax=Lottia gigantea TaxID=225164 RepID=V4C2P8_LOTGI|nr:hypothetical protein LOTGIDRAFT_231964 [Lottia gigantea]ESO95799.1 hypothetical protein LOTGIDRAFT_231964 [Lottia gigantea]